MSSFSAVNNNDGTFRIECLFIVYFEKFKHHPDWLVGDNAIDGYHKPTPRDLREGVSTKFWILVEDNILPDAINARLASYRNKYDKLIPKLENDDSRWNEFPFQNPKLHYVTYHK